MDTPLLLSPWRRHKKILLPLLSLTLLLSLWWMAAPSAERSLQVDASTLQMGTVVEGIFKDFIPLRAQVMPLHSLYLDAVEGGSVERVYVEDGAQVEEGQRLLDVANTRLQLDSISREAQVSEQINLMQSQELSLARNELDHRRTLNELRYAIKVLKRKRERAQTLLASHSIAQAEWDALQDELEYLQHKQALTLEARAADQALQAAQMKQLRDSVASLQASLVFARENLAGLNIKAPRAGRLTAFNLEVGQSLHQGERIGQIDDPERFKLLAMVDEFYLARVFVDQQAELILNEKSYRLRLAKTYPQVSEGQYRVDFEFGEQQPDMLSRGQTLQLRLQLGDDEPARLIPRGSFAQETGGHWVFVVAADGKTAQRRSIRLGRRNRDQFEVLEGLVPGERIIISSYSLFLEIDNIKIN
jgi:HlyD family secretion protein